MGLTGFSLLIFSAYSQENPQSTEQTKQVKEPLKPISSGARDPREDLYLSKLKTNSFTSLSRNQYVRQIAEVFLYSPKYRLVVDSLSESINQEFQLEVEIIRTGGRYTITSKVLGAGEIIESSKVTSRGTRREILLNFRKSLYLLLLGEENYNKDKKRLDRLSSTSVTKALYVPPKPKYSNRPYLEKSKKKKYKKKKKKET